MRELTPAEDFADNPKIDLYQRYAQETAIYPGQYQTTYPILGLVGEVGEFANKWKKVLRDNKEFELEDQIAELGDILWYLAAICNDSGIELSEVATHNLEKLFDRKERGVLGGSGDNR